MQTDYGRVSWSKYIGPGCVNAAPVFKEKSALLMESSRARVWFYVINYLLFDTRHRYTFGGTISENHMQQQPQ